MDALLLAAFAAAGRPARTLVDLGSGVGGLAIAVHHFAQPDHLALVERDAEIARLARENLLIASARGAVHIADLEKEGLPRELVTSADLVVVNPPFHELIASRRCHDARSDAARCGPLQPFVSAAATAMAGGRARAVFAYPARSLSILLDVANAHGLVPKRLRLVHAAARVSARLALVELRRARPGGLEVEPPVIEWVGRGIRSRELDRLVSTGVAGSAPAELAAD